MHDTHIGYFYCTSFHYIKIGQLIILYVHVTFIVTSVAGHVVIYK